MKHAWIERLPRERFLITIAFLGIVLWGFTGSWDYPTVETSTAVAQAPLRQAIPEAAMPAGAQLFEANGCYACHSLEGAKKIGPSLLGIYGENVELEDGSIVPIDKAYLVESILAPDAKRVAGYAEAAMPSYDGLITVAEAEALADYIAGLE